MKSYNTHDELTNTLMKQFPSDKIRWRIGRAGNKNGKIWATLLAYVDARDVRSRLDEAFGRMHWGVEYDSLPNGTILATVWGEADINGTVVRKQATDGAGETQVEKEKGGISDAFKRAANASFGIYEHLYELGACFATVKDNGKHKGQYKDGSKTVYFKYDPPNIGSSTPQQKKAKPTPSPQSKPKTAVAPPQDLGVTIDDVIAVIPEEDLAGKYRANGFLKDDQGIKELDDERMLDLLTKFKKNPQAIISWAKGA